MSTDFNYGGKQIVISGPIKPGGKDMPSDARTRVECYADIATIPNPHVGLKITVKVDETNNNKMTDYIVKSLKANSAGIANTLIDEVVRYVDYLGASSGGSVSQEDINTAVDKYLTEHPVASGATAEQAAQIEANRTAIGDSNSGLIKEINNIKNTELQNLNAAILGVNETLGDKTGLPSGDANVIASINRIDSKPSGTITNEQISTAVNNYLTEHPVQSGATTEQAAQIEANKTAIGDNTSGLIKKVNDIEAQLGEEDISNLEGLRTDRVLIWHDEFDKPELDETKWGHLVGGYKADKHRYYMYEDVSKNVYCNNSILHITNLKDYPTSTIDFSGAFIHTHEKFEFKYGLIEAKIKFPNAPAYHGTLWSMSTNYIPTDMLIYSGIKSNTHGSSKGENDIAECDQKNVSCILHSTANDAFGFKSIGTGTEWHIYSCEWTETEMKYYLDGTLINTINLSPANNNDGSTNPFNKPHFLILNMNPYMNSVNDQTKEFLDWQIDWVRVYAPVSVPDKKETSMVLNINDTTIDNIDSDYKALKAIFTPDICDQTIKWESYNENVAIVKGGDVFPVAAGTTYVKATTKNGLVDFCKIVVGGGSGATGDGTFEVGYISDTGVIVKDPNSNSTNAASTNYTEVLPNTTYTIYVNSSIPHDSAKIAQYDENKTFISRVLTDTITTSSNAKYIRFSIGNARGIDATKLSSSLVYVMQKA